MRSLNLVCREIRDRVLAPDSALWRARFGDKFDIPAGRTNAELKTEYQIRAIVLPQTIDFNQEKSEHQTFWLEVLQQMLIESLILPVNPDTSKTYERIQEILTESELLEHPKRENPSELFCTVQLCLTTLALTIDPPDKKAPAIKNKCSRSEYDIGIVYSHGMELRGPFIDHKRLDLATLLHMRSFWQRHIVNNAEQSFHDSFARLPEDHRPQARNANVDNGASLSVSWLGYYSCLHPMPTTRKDFEDQQSCADLRGAHLSQVDIMTLDIHTKPGEPFWPEECSKFIPQFGDDEVNRIYLEGVQSTLGGDPANNPVFGFTEAIANPYGGFPGWTRICFAICKQPDESDEEEANDDAGSDASSNWVHGYEGVILPGGRVMLGRWMDLKNMDASGRGPFLFWDL
ncbi:uncharacterized protein N7482_002295 [Penicillium canariense]|uniref:Uncharacterized protein n=1 Tax=Penicillium canariense TaxID=189055 RepID=A0A9W9LTR9_9EURO|nr:uncharacterized protein N7482_002295 [Penicillium canariense]KAJ5176418.1 hypothetical protein N7482_002295 [Penicillium canariense]